MINRIYRGVRHERQSRLRQAPADLSLIYRGVAHDGLLQNTAWSPGGDIDMSYRGVRYRSLNIAARPLRLISARPVPAQPPGQTDS